MAPRPHRRDQRLMTAITVGAVLALGVAWMTRRAWRRGKGRDRGFNRGGDLVRPALLAVVLVFVAGRAT